MNWRWERGSYNAGTAEIWIDSSLVKTVDLREPGEDQLARILLGELGAGEHEVDVRHSGPDGSYLYLDYLEVFVRQGAVSSYPADAQLTLAADWDTDHSLAIPPSAPPG
jgi:hypothetical protein